MSCPYPALPQTHPRHPRTKKDNPSHLPQRIPKPRCLALRGAKVRPEAPETASAQLFRRPCNKRWQPDRGWSMPGRGGTGRTRHRLEHSHLAALPAATNALQLARATPGRRPVGRATAPCPSRLASPQRTSHLLPQRSRIRWHRPRVRLAPWGLPSPGRCLPVRACRRSQPARTPRRFRLESFRNSGAGVTNAAPRCSRLRRASSPDGISSQSVKLAPARFAPWRRTSCFTARR